MDSPIIQRRDDGDYDQTTNLNSSEEDNKYIVIHVSIIFSVIIFIVITGVILYLYRRRLRRLKSSATNLNRIVNITHITNNGDGILDYYSNDYSSDYNKSSSEDDSSSYNKIIHPQLEHLEPVQEVDEPIPPSSPTPSLTKENRNYFIYGKSSGIIPRNNNEIKKLDNNIIINNGTIKLISDTNHELGSDNNNDGTIKYNDENNDVAIKGKNNDVAVKGKNNDVAVKGKNNDVDVKLKSDDEAIKSDKNNNVAIKLKSNDDAIKLKSGKNNDDAIKLKSDKINDEPIKLKSDNNEVTNILNKLLNKKRTKVNFSLISAPVTSPSDSIYNNEKADSLSRTTTRVIPPIPAFSSINYTQQKDLPRVPDMTGNYLIPRYSDANINTVFNDNPIMGITRKRDLDNKIITTEEVLDMIPINEYVGGSNLKNSN